MAAKWVRIFEVPETKRHNKGHTIYQVKSTVFPRSSPEACTSVVVWRRYSELRRLYKSISEIHQKLGLPGQLPPFPRATLLNRFEADVVEARRQAALNLLKFIGQHSALFTSEPFTKFFETEESDGKKFKTSRKDSKGRSKEAENLAATLGIQGLSSLYSQISDTEDDFSVCSSLDSPISPVPVEPIFPTCHDASLSVRPQFSDTGSKGGIGSEVLYSNSSAIAPKSKDIKPNSREVTSNNGVTFSNSQTLNAQNGNISNMTDKVPEIPGNQGRGVYQGWNALFDDPEEDIFSFDTEGKCAKRKGPDQNAGERHPSASSQSSVSSQPCCIYENPVHDSPKHHQKTYPAEDVQMFRSTGASEKGPQRSVPPIDVSRRISISGRKNSVPLTPLTPLTKSVIPIIPNSKVPSPQEVASSQYIFVAAQQISEAQQHEQQREYKQALNMYREGVGTLLQGVQASSTEDQSKKRVDNDGSRREAVRRKTAQYLQRAEQLVARLTRKEKKKDQDCDSTAVEANLSGEAGLKCRASDLQRYRVVGSAGTVIIATDTTTGDTLAIKVLIKSGIGSGEKTIVPQNVPFMVPIVRYHETDSAIYLVLKFISGGKLWSHISKYVSDNHFGLDDLFDVTGDNTYAGRRLLIENMDCDGLAIDGLSLCETPSVASNVSSLQSCPPPPPCSANLLTVPGNSSVDGCSTCSDASSSCLPDGYLPIISDYTPSMPSSSSMVAIAPMDEPNQDDDLVPKSISAGALIMEAECLAEELSIEKFQDVKLSAADERNLIGGAVCQIGNNEELNGDSVSIGSDTLSGVSEDFSCSLPPSVPDLLPDPLPLPEVKITSDCSDVDESNCRTESNRTGGEKQTRMGEKASGPSNIDGAVLHCDNFYETCDKVDVNLDGDSKVTDLMGRLDMGSPDTHLKVEDDRDEISITDTSFGSVTLPSFSWTKKDDSELASLDIEDLIRNSKMLLQNVDHTLQQSKCQSTVTINESDESASVDHSELPYDSANGDQGVKGKSLIKGGKLCAVKHCGSARSLYDNVSAHSEIEVSSQKLSKKDRLQTKESSNSIALPVKVGANEVEIDTKNNRENLQRLSTSLKFEPQARLDVHNSNCPGDENKNCSNESDLKNKLSPSRCSTEPLENSIGSLLEQYSASRGQDARPTLPEGLVRVWSSQVISCLTALHNIGIIWGDFCPDNILLDEGGSILLTYESRWSCIQHDIRGGKGWKIVDGEATFKWKSYLAPELDSPLTYPSAASDWWSIGALMYHMLTGLSVSAAHPSGITSHTEISLPAHLSTEAASLLSQLLCAHPTERLGGGIAGPQEIKDHAFFTGVQWTE